MGILVLVALKANTACFNFNAFFKLLEKALANGCFCGVLVSHDEAIMLNMAIILVSCG